MINLADFIKNSKINFGTSGARGLVIHFTPQVCAAFTKSFILNIKQKYNFNKIAIAIDNRPSSYTMAQSCASAIIELGLTPIYYGVIPTPALAYKAMQDNIPCIMVTGSHIPFDRNGLKFYRPDGEINKTDELAIINCQEEFTFNNEPPELIPNPAAYQKYLTRYTDFFDASLLAGKRIGIYQHSSAGRDLYPELFTLLGAEVVCLGRSDHFVPIDTEAVSEQDCEIALKWVQDYKLDALFSTDGDGDRPLVAGNDGIWLRGDILGLLTSQYLTIQALSVPVSCNTAIEQSGIQHVIRTKIGSPYVIAEFDSLITVSNPVAGFEANGGYLLASDLIFNNKCLKALPTRDAILPFLSFMALANQKQVKTCQLIRQLPKRFTHSDRLTNFPKYKSNLVLKQIKADPYILLEKLNLSHLKVNNINEIDGLRLTLANHDIIHLRPSGNAPELRCYTESTTSVHAKLLVNDIIKILVKDIEYL